MFRGMFEKATNTDLSHVSDTELLDTYSYTFFPNLFLFPGISLPMIYRFRPDARDHRRDLYEVMFMRPAPKDGAAPEPAEVEILQDHQSFAEAKGMDPGFGAILDQDTDNLFAAAGRARGQRQARHDAGRLSGNPRPPLRAGGRQVHGDGPEEAGQRATTVALSAAR